MPFPVYVDEQFAEKDEEEVRVDGPVFGSVLLLGVVSFPCWCHSRGGVIPVVVYVLYQVVVSTVPGVVL